MTRRAAVALAAILLLAAGLGAAPRPAAAVIPAGPSTPTPYWPGWDVARDVALLPDGSGGFVLDGFGGIHPFGLAGNPAPARPSGLPSWRGWDIARGLVLRSATSGYVVDGFGGIHRFGGAPAVQGAPYWPGWNIARDVALVPSGDGGFVLDGFGGIHPFGVGAGAAPARPSGGGYWRGLDIARDLALLSDGSGGQMLDGRGGVHRVGGPSVVPDTPVPYWPRDLARGLAFLPDRSGGYQLDAYGGLHRFSLGIGVPSLTVSTTFMTGLNRPWDLGFTPDGFLLYTERTAGISAALANGTSRRLLLDPDDLVASGEGGMLGLALDPAYASNRRIYACFASNASGATDVRVVRFTVNGTTTALTNRADIVTGLPYSSGRHSGCRPRFGPDGALWVGTGDAAIGTTPQHPTVLGGKVLRVDTDGAAASGNPDLGAGFDPRIWSYGHRNVQGLAFAPGDPAWRGVSVEHGPGRDDEVNRLVPGNFGWDPVPGYNEAVPMTDLVKFPGAVSAVWASGDPTIAPSGATFLTGSQWLGWNGAIAMAVLKASRVQILFPDSSGVIVGTTVPGALQQGVRLRSAVQGPDGNLYLTTDGRAGGDQIWRVVPS